MLNVSNAFNEAFKSDLREIKMRVTVNDVTYTDDDIISFNYNSSSIVGETYAIGSTFANSIKMTLCKIVEGLKQLDVVKPEMGIVLPDGSTEFVKLGTFLISEQVNPDRNENRTSLECTDKMLMLDDKYESKLSYPAEIRAVALEIANLAGVEVDKVSFGRLRREQIRKPEGYTLRQAIGLIAQFESGYATFDREGLLSIRQLTDKNFEVTPHEYFLKGLVKNELIFRPSGIRVKTGENEADVMSIGSDKGSVIKLDNKVMEKNLLESIYEKVAGINYYPYTLNWRGNPAIEAGDWLYITDLKGNKFKVPNLSYSLEYKGGLTAKSSVETVASNEVKFGYKSVLDQTIEYVNDALKNAEGNLVYYGVEEPPNPKEGDIWFKKNGPDTEIWVYERIGDSDKFEWVFKISTAKDDTIKEKIEELEGISNIVTERSDKALKEAEAAREAAKEARDNAFKTEKVAMQVKVDLDNLDYKTTNYITDSSSDWKEIVLGKERNFTTVNIYHRTSDKTLKTETLKLEIGTIYTFKSTNFDDYVLSDEKEKKVSVSEGLAITFMYSKRIIETNVEIVCVNERKEVIKRDFKTLAIDSQYTFLAPIIDKYELIDGNSQSVIIKENMKITFNYKTKKEVKFIDISIEYVDRTKNSLIKRDTLKLEEGSNHEFKSIEIPGYQLDDDSVKRAVIKESLFIRFYYTEIKHSIEITVNYINQDTNDTIESEVKVFDLNSVQTLLAKQIDGYELISEAEQKITVKDHAVIAFYYKPIKMAENNKLIISYVDIQTRSEVYSYTTDAKIGQTIDIPYKPIEDYELKDEFWKRVIVLEHNQKVIFNVTKKETEPSEPELPTNNNLLIDNGTTIDVRRADNGYYYQSLWEFSKGNLANTAEPGDKLIFSYLVTGNVPKNPPYFMIQTDNGVAMSSWIPFSEMKTGERYSTEIEFKQEYKNQTTSKKIGVLITGLGLSEVLSVSEPKLINATQVRNTPLFKSSAPELMSRSVLSTENATHTTNHNIKMFSGETSFYNLTDDIKNISKITIEVMNETLLESETLSSVLIDASANCTLVVGQVDKSGVETIYKDGLTLKEGFLETKSLIKKGTKLINIYLENMEKGVANKVKYKFLQLQKGNKRQEWTPASKDIALTGRFATLEHSIEGFRQTVVNEYEGVKATQTQLANQIDLRVEKKELDAINQQIKTTQSNITVLNNQIALITGSSKLNDLTGKIEKMESSITMLNNQIDLKVSANELISKINVSPERIRLDSKLIHLSGQSLIDDAVIKSAMIEDLNANKITTGTLNAARVNIINLNASNITTGTIDGNLIKANSITARELSSDAIQVGLNNFGDNIKLSENELNFYKNRTLSGKITDSGQEFWYGSRYIGSMGERGKLGDASCRGISNQLSYEGDYITWSYKESSYSDAYKSMLTLDPKGRYTGEAGVHIDQPLWVRRISTNSGQILVGRLNTPSGYAPCLTTERENAGIAFNDNIAYLYSGNVIADIEKIARFFAKLGSGEVYIPTYISNGTVQTWKNFSI